MAERRMFAKSIVNSDAFGDMPASSRLLYFRYGMEADDEGFIINPKQIMRMSGASEDDIRVLVAKHYIIPFVSGVIAITHWLVHNAIRKDRYKPTQCIEEKKMLRINDKKEYFLVEGSSKIKDVTFDEKKNPYLTEDEAFRLGLGIKELFFNSFSEMPKRVVVHKRTPFKAEEIKGLTKCLVNAGIAEVDLIEIAHEDNAKCFALNRQLNLDGFPIKRGTCFPYNDNSAFLYTHGVAASIRNVNYSYIQGGKGIPTPLKIVKHYGSGDMTQIISEILGLSKMNWNSFGLYTKMPCTIDSSNQIARIGWLLSNYEGATYEFRHFM